MEPEREVNPHCFGFTETRGQRRRNICVAKELNKKGINVLRFNYQSLGAMKVNLILEKP